MTDSNIKRFAATPLRVIQDSLANALTGMGFAGRDKSVSTYYRLNILTKDQLENAYRGDWIARKAVQIPAMDATREWRSWQADKQDITKLEDEEKRLDVQRKLKRAMWLGRLYGGGALLLGTSDSDVTQELVPEAIGQGGLRYLHFLSCYELIANELETDVESPYFNQPKDYTLTTRSGETTLIHPSRVIRFIGSELPDPSLAVTGNNGWGDSIVQVIDDAVKAVGAVANGTANLVQEAKVDVLKLQQLDEMVTAKDFKNSLNERLLIMNSMKSLYGVTVMDAREEWDQKQIQFGSLPQLVQMYLMIASGAVDIPATRFLGQSPVGMNATGESDTRNYYDRVRAEQTTELTPTIRQLDECLVVSAFGTRPDDIWYEWRPLWASSENEKADIALKKAQAFTADVATGLINEQALREGRENQLIEDGTYPGFEQALQDAEAMQQAALNELDPEVRAIAEQHKLEQQAGVPRLPPPSAMQEPMPPVAAAAAGDAYALGLTAYEIQQRGLSRYARLRKKKLASEQELSSEGLGSGAGSSE